MKSHRFQVAGHNRLHSDEVIDQAYELNPDSLDQEGMVRKNQQHDLDESTDGQDNMTVNGQTT